ncbi:MAG: hypothetical protein Q4G68_14255 [Planctomycetia bacterium]|nr:hypothetical protein [Planctomycetia bacterium]
MSTLATLLMQNEPGAVVPERHALCESEWPCERELTDVFRALCEKYSVAIPQHWRLTGGSCSCGSDEILLVPAGGAYRCDVVPLLYWRQERRFMELQKLVSTRTIEDVVMCRFSCTGSRSGESLSQIMFREYDLLEWITNSAITDLYATMYDGVFANVVATITSGAVCSIEVGSTLPRGHKSENLDRHELIARRGVASDRVVDTQIPQQSIYLYKESSRETWTDCDAELFGLPMNAIYLIRAAFELAKRVNNDRSLEKMEIAKLRNRARRLDQLVTVTCTAARNGERAANLDRKEDCELFANTNPCKGQQERSNV